MQIGLVIDRVIRVGATFHGTLRRVGIGIVANSSSLSTRNDGVRLATLRDDNGLLDIFVRLGHFPSIETGRCKNVFDTYGRVFKKNLRYCFCARNRLHDTFRLSRVRNPTVFELRSSYRVNVIRKVSVRPSENRLSQKAFFRPLFRTRFSRRFFLQLAACRKKCFSYLGFSVKHNRVVGV